MQADSPPGFCRSDNIHTQNAIARTLQSHSFETLLTETTASFLKNRDYDFAKLNIWSYFISRQVLDSPR